MLTPCSHGVGQILDIVPNHMSVAAGENSWWNDVLENGPSSPYAAYFDIDWSPMREGLRGKVLLPLLGEQYGQILESGELKLEYRNGAFFIRYHDAVLPLEPRTYRSVLAWNLEELEKGLTEAPEDLRELQSILTALEHLPPPYETDAARLAERLREKEVIKGRLAGLSGRSPAIAGFVESNVRQFNGAAGDSRSFDRLDELLSSQIYRLAHWKAAADEINYRRFFDISELAAVCMEDAKVFEDSHRLVSELLARGNVNGLRVDHIDGLYDPLEYLERLQREYLRVRPEDLPGDCRRDDRVERPGTAFPRGDRRPAASFVRCGGEDPRPRGAAAQRLAGGRHHRLRLFEFRRRSVRGPARAGRGREDVQPFRQRACELPRDGLPVQVANSPRGHGQRGAVARQPHQSHFRAAPAFIETSLSTSCGPPSARSWPAFRCIALTFARTVSPSRIGSSLAARWRKPSLEIRREIRPSSTSFATCC